MNTLKRYGLLVLGILCLVAATSSRNPTWQQIDILSIDALQVGSSTGAVVGTHGVLLGGSGGTGAAIRNGGSAVYSHFTWTSSLAQPSYPGRLTARIYDADGAGSTANVYTCSGIITYGLNSLGQSVAEDWTRYYATPLTETATTSKWAYIRLDKVEVTGCKSSNGSSAFEAADEIRMWLSGRYVGTPSPFTKHGSTSTDPAIVSVCSWPSVTLETTDNCYDKADLYRFVVDDNYMTIDLFSGYQGAAPTHDGTAMTGLRSIEKIKDRSLLLNYEGWSYKILYKSRR